MVQNELFISGESYGGIYVPYLSWQIYQHNKLVDDKILTGGVRYNLKGFMVGNGATDWDFDVSPSFPSIAYNFNLIPKKTYDEYTSLECVVYFNDFKPRTGKNVTRCSELWDGENNT